MQTEKEMEFKQAVQEAGERFVESARELLDALKDAQEESDSTDAEDAARRAIDEYPLSILTRSGWHNPGTINEADAEFEILLGTGGPASRIVGRLNEYAEPDSAYFEYQDWFQPWTQARLSGEQTDTLLEFARQFYFGG